VPLERPVTVIGDDEAVPVNPPGLDVAVKDVAAGPVPAGVKVIVAWVFPAVAVPIIGARGCKCPVLDEAITPEMIGIRQYRPLLAKYLLQF
jgi:hypothetical protein